MPLGTLPSSINGCLSGCSLKPLSEPVPEQRRGDRIRTLTEEMNNHHVAEKALNEKCYALSVELLSECGGSRR